MNELCYKKKIAVVGQGYVGLPLAIELAYFFPVVGFDIDRQRVEELMQGKDHTNEANVDRLSAVSLESRILESASKVCSPNINHRPMLQANGNDIDDSLQSQSGLTFSHDEQDIKDAQIYIVTVPTPVDRHNAPDLAPLQRASEMLGRLIKPGDIVIYESTVYPGCTEEECVPILERVSGMALNKDFFIGYSPERVNPGDKTNTFTTIRKVTSGSTVEIAEEIDQLYKTVIKAGTYKAPSIKVAEAAKAIENAQRDLNISFVNELALIFDRMGIDTNDVLDAASTKFNFLKYKPGLVGGHCISVDPYYLTHKAGQLGYYPEVILSGRRVNNSIPSFIAGKVVKLMTAKGITIRDSRALILGVTFKENCPDIRNTKVIEIYHELQEFGVEVDLYDPWADSNHFFNEYRLQLLPVLPCDEGGMSDKRVNEKNLYDAVILATAHDEFLRVDITQIRKERSIVFDTKAILPRSEVDARL